MDTNEKVAACTKIFEAQNPKTAYEERLACRDKPPPADGPDICYCLKASYPDEEVIAKCESITEDMIQLELRKHIYDCAGKSF